MKHFKKYFRFVAIIGVLCLLFQNCGKGFTSTLADNTSMNLGSSASPNPPSTGLPNPSLRTQQVVLNSVQTVDSEKILILVDFDLFPLKTSMAQTVFNANILGLLQSLKGKNVTIGFATADPLQYLYSGQTTVLSRTDGGPAIDLSQALPPLQDTHYVASPFGYQSSGPTMQSNLAIMTTLFGKQVLFQTNYAPSPMLTFALTPNSTDADLQMMVTQMQTAASQSIGSPSPIPLGVLAQYFGDSGPMAFFQPTDAISTLLFSDNTDCSGISNSIKQTNIVENVTRWRRFIGTVNLVDYEYQDPSQNNILIDVTTTAGISDWAKSQSCSPRDLAAVQAKYPGKVTISCTYSTSSPYLLSSAVSNVNDDLCTTAFDLNGIHYTNAVDYFQKQYPTATNSCVTSDYIYQPTPPAQANLNATNFMNFYAVTDLEALQTNNIQLGIASLVKAKFPSATINSVVHIDSESCVLPAQSSYASKIEGLSNYDSQAFAFSLCGNGYASAFAKVAATAGGSQQKASLSVQRQSNEVVDSVYVTQSSGVTLQIPSYSLSYQGDTLVLTSPLIHNGDTISIQFKTL